MSLHTDLLTLAYTAWGCLGENDTEKKLIRRAVVEAMNKPRPLRTREIMVLTLSHCCDYSPSQVAFIMGVTRSRIYAIYSAATRKLRHPCRRAALERSGLPSFHGQRESMHLRESMNTNTTSKPSNKSKGS